MKLCNKELMQQHLQIFFSFFLATGWGFQAIWLSGIFQATWFARVFEWSDCFGFSSGFIGWGFWGILQLKAANLFHLGKYSQFPNISRTLT